MNTSSLEIHHDDKKSSMAMARPARQVVLLVEDCPRDAMIFAFAIETVRPDVRVKIVSSPGEARRYLQGDGDYADRSRFPLPTLFVVDLGAENRSGFSFLAWRRANPVFRQLPLLVLTQSDLQPVHRALRHTGASACYRKTYVYDDLLSMASRVAAKFLLPVANAVPATQLPDEEFTMEGRALAAA